MSAIPFTEPMECLSVEALAEGPEWSYEIKLDGYRGQVVHSSTGCLLLPRNGKDLRSQFPSIFKATPR